MKRTNNIGIIYTKQEIEFIEDYISMIRDGLESKGFNCLKQYELEMKLDIIENELSIEFLEDIQETLERELHTQAFYDKQNNRKSKSEGICEILNKNIEYAKKLEKRIKEAEKIMEQKLRVN